MTHCNTWLILLLCALAVLSAASPSLTGDGEHVAGARLEPELFQSVKSRPLGKRRSLLDATGDGDTAALEQLTQDYLIVEGQHGADKAPVLDSEDREAATDTEEHEAPVIDAADQAQVAGTAAEAAPVLGGGAAAEAVEQQQHGEKQQPKEAASSGLPSFGSSPLPPKQTLKQWRQRTVAAVNSNEEMSSGVFLLPSHPKKGYAAVCLIVRDTHDDVGEWVGHNLRLGFWPIYIFDDGSAPPMADALRRYTDSGDVVYTFLTTFTHVSNKPQLYVYDRCLQEYGSKHSWMAFFDVDEFLIFRSGPPVQSVPALLRRYENSSALAVHWLLFGSSGHEVRPSKGVLRSYTRCVPPLHAQHLFVKSIVNTRCTTGTTETPHTFVHNCSAPAVRTDFSPVFAATAEDLPVHAALALHHYATKSVEEFEIKMLRGSGMRRQRGWEYFAFVDDWSVDFNFDGLRAWDDDVGMPSRIDSGEALEEQLSRYAGEEHEEYWKTARRGQAQLWLHGQAQAELFAGQGAGQGDDEAGADAAQQGGAWKRALHRGRGGREEGSAGGATAQLLVEVDKKSGLEEAMLPP